LQRRARRAAAAATLAKAPSQPGEHLAERESG